MLLSSKLLTRQSSCGKPQKVYRPRHNLSKRNLSRGEGGGGLVLSRQWSIQVLPLLGGGGEGITPLPPPGTGVVHPPSHLGLRYPLLGTRVPLPRTGLPPPQKGPGTRNLGRNLGLGYLPPKGPRTSHWGTLPERTWDQWLKYYGMLADTCKNITSCRTAYGGGDNSFM